MRGLWWTALAAAGLVLAILVAAPGQAGSPAASDAVPSAAPAKPARPRRLLVFTLTKGWYTHESTAVAAAAFEALGKKTGAYEATVSQDLAMLKAGQLAEFDALLLVNTQGDFLVDPEMRKGFLDYVKNGKGVAALHGAADANPDWPEYAELIGGLFAGHNNWNRASVKLDDPTSPLTAIFGGKGFALNDEIYTFKGPYSRDKLHILLSMDYKASRLGGGNRSDDDYALSWIHEYGKGRVFYCAFGHSPEIFRKPEMLTHYLAGIQYALGDLKADATPSSKTSLSPAPAPPFKP
jgi:type 1 glutamine amidotransferase